MTDDTKPCTVIEAVSILGEISRHHDAGKAAPDLDAKIARLQTLSDHDLTVLSTSRDIFALKESNRRLALALREEARRTTLLTIGILILTAILVLREFRHPEPPQSAAVTSSAEAKRAAPAVPAQPSAPQQQPK